VWWSLTLKVWNWICRHPMPDYYSAMLEIAKDRATAASMVTCSTADFDAGRCPDEVAVGDRYLKRAVNEPCRKLVSRHRAIFYHTSVACCSVFTPRCYAHLQTRKPCCRKETARCCSCSFRFLTFANNINYKFKHSQASKTMLQSSKHTGAK